MDSQPSANLNLQSSSAAPRLVPIAPASNLSPVPQNGEGETPLMQFTCVTCAKRKVKCDKTPAPCGACRKGRLECYYQEPVPRKQKRKPVDDLQDRLDRYEKLLKEYGILGKEGKNSSLSPAETATASNASGGLAQSPNFFSSTSFSGFQKPTGTLRKGEGKSRYIDSGVWSNLGEDLHPSSDEEDADYGDQIEAPMSAEQLDPASFAFFGPTTPNQSLLSVHPTYDLAVTLWELYVRNVDPIIRILHLPTGREMVQRAAANPSAASKVTECLLFAIYHFAVSSTSAQECEEKFHQPRAVLERSYHNATRQALVTVHFLRTTELAVLQAYILFLLSTRNRYDPHTFWILTGIAVRIGQRIGLHKDGEELGLNPFDVQMRRRLFWQLLPLDGLSGQLSGTGIAIISESWDTKQPLNVNDEDIWPGMEKPPVERKGATDMIFCLARTEIGRFHQKVKPVLGNWAKLWEAQDVPIIYEALQELQDSMEEKYIRYCDISIPAHLLTLAMARGSVNSARLRVRVGRAKVQGASPAERQDMYALAVKILDLDISVHTHPNLDRYLWHMREFFQWDAIIFVVTEISEEDSLVNQDEAWKKLEEIFSYHPELTNWTRSIDVALARLVLKSWDGMKWKNGPPFATPQFIETLRRAFSKREASRQTSGTPQTMPTNPFDPAPNFVADVPVNNYLSSNIAWGYTNYKNVNYMTNNEDWMFWDNLIQDPQAFPAV